jgi:hypothetical protein
MLTKLFPFLDPASIPPDLPAKLRRLATDLESLSHRPVSAFALRDAPAIDGWAAMLAPVGVCLIGQATRHPRLGNRPVITSPLYAADPDGRWVRTTSRFYRLGEPADAAARDLLEQMFAASGGTDDDGGVSEGRE